MSAANLKNDSATFSTTLIRSKRRISSWSNRIMPNSRFATGFRVSKQIRESEGILIQLLVVPLGRIKPYDEAQLLALVVACNFPAPGSRYINAGQHRGMRNKERVCHFVHYKWRSVSIEASSGNLYGVVLFFVVIKIKAPPKNLG